MEKPEHIHTTPKTNLKYTCYLLFIILLTSCAYSHDKESALLQIDELSPQNPSQALLLTDSIPFEKYNDYNKAYYYLLLAELRHKNNTLSITNDSLLTFSLKHFKKAGDKTLISRALLAKGRLWHKLNDTQEAFGYFTSALDNLPTQPNSRLLSSIYNELGNIYMEQSLYDDAISMFELEYQCDSAINNYRYMAISLSGLGKAYAFKNQPDRSLQYFDEASAMAARDSDSLYLKSEIYKYISVHFQDQGDNEKAIRYITKSMEYSVNGADITDRYLSMGYIYADINAPDSARHYFSKSLLSTNPYTHIESLYGLYQVEYDDNNFQQAIGYLNDYQKHADSLYVASFDSKIQALAYKYNVERAVTHVRNQRDIIIISLISVFIILVMAISVAYTVRDKKRKLKIIAIQQLKLRAEKDILRKETEIKSLRKNIERLRDEISSDNNREEIARYEELIEQKKSEVFSILAKTVHDEVNTFTQTNIYSRIKELGRQEKNKDYKILTYDEQEVLSTEIKKSFPQFIYILKESCPSLTDDDIKLCCLSVARLKPFPISLCYTVSGTNSIKQRRHRIKQKMTEASENDLLFEFIFLKR